MSYLMVIILTSGQNESMHFFLLQRFTEMNPRTNRFAEMIQTSKSHRGSSCSVSPPPRMLIGPAVTQWTSLP